jgi:hypothetical protein
LAPLLLLQKPICCCAAARFVCAKAVSQPLLLLRKLSILFAVAGAAASTVSAYCCPNAPTSQNPAIH